MKKQVKDKFYAEIVLRSRTGASLINRTIPLTPERIKFFEAHDESRGEIKQRLEKLGFEIAAESAFGISLIGPLKLFQEYFNLKVKERKVHMFLGSGAFIEHSSLFMESPPKLPQELSDMAETIYVPPKGYFLAGEGPMPSPSYYHLKPPSDIVRLTGAAHAHSRGFNGSGVKVAMIDSGFINNHDYYTNKNYNITIHAVVGSANQDEYGHGTGIAANLLAIAPDCEFHFYKMSDGTQWATLAAFRRAVADGVKIITNSWGQGRDPVLEAEIVSAVASGITVIFACGNGGPVGWPGCMPEVISVGGAFPNEDGQWEASSYASSGYHPRYPDRHCPDLSAIVGQAPRGILIVMPTMAGSIFDSHFSGSSFPNKDETGPNDGWLVASGTSSAAPMVAGAAAILLQAKSSLTPSEIKDILKDTCIDVLNGTSASGEPAGVGPDSATGAGMINIGAAVEKVLPPKFCRIAPICHRAPICYRAPICRVAPICYRAPICRVAPVCHRAPICYRAPICRIAPVCYRMPSCMRAPLDVCRAAPIVGCKAGPWMKPDRPGEIIERGRISPRRNRRNLVPITILVDESELENWTDYYGEEHCGDVGLEEEYEEFPDIDECYRGPFDPEWE